ncbi:mucin-2, partial [Streptomyces sp. URMC 124]
RPLVDALTSARLVVGWDLKPAEWLLLEALVQRCGIPTLVASATASWQGARTQPRSARYFVPAWRALPDAPAQPVDLPAAVGADVLPFKPLAPAPSTHNESVLARARARLQEQHRDH